MNIDDKIYIPCPLELDTRYMEIGLNTWSYMKIVRDSMKQIGTFRLKVVSAVVSKTLSKGTKTKYKYGSVSVQTPQLSDYVGKEVMIRIFDEQKKKAKR